MPGRFDRLLVPPFLLSGLRAALSGGTTGNSMVRLGLIVLAAVAVLALVVLVVSILSNRRLKKTLQKEYGRKRR